MRELDDYLSKVKNLPPAPRILPELLLLLQEEDVDASRVVSLIGYDPGLTANVLQLCNSAYFGLATPAEDLQEAVTQLGFNQVFQLVAAVIGARNLAPPQKGYGIDRGELWRHSVTSAVAAQLVAQEQGGPDTIVYTAALLHDIGKIILSDALEYVYGRLMTEIQENQQPLVDAEKQLLGVHHAEIGGRLLARWHLPENIVSAVTFHHDPNGAGPQAPLASYVYLGNMLAHFMGVGYGHQAFAMRGRREALENLGLTADDLPRFMIATFEKMAFIEALFRVSS